MKRPEKGSYLDECVYTQGRPLKHVVSSLSAACRPVANALVCRGGNRDLLVGQLSGQS